MFLSPKVTWKDTPSPGAQLPLWDPPELGLASWASAVGRSRPQTLLLKLPAPLAGPFL